MRPVGTDGAWLSTGPVPHTTRRRGAWPVAVPPSFEKYRAPSPLVLFTIRLTTLPAATTGFTSHS